MPRARGVPFFALEVFRNFAKCAGRLAGRTVLELGVRPDWGFDPEIRVPKNLEVGRRRFGPPTSLSQTNASLGQLDEGFDPEIGG